MILEGRKPDSRKKKPVGELFLALSLISFSFVLL